jgi:hypothetical protein
MFQVEFYNPDKRNDWDTFLKNNGMYFQFYRSYIEYPQRSIQDKSLIVSVDGQLVALFPACLSSEKSISSHSGLSYGGILTRWPNRTQVWRLVCDFYRKLGYEQIIIRPQPSIYEAITEDDFFEPNFIPERQEELVWIDLNKKLTIKKLRRRCVKKSHLHQLTFSPEKRVAEFWTKMNQDLMDRHQTRALHNLAQFSYLIESFPEHIKLYSACLQDEILAGTVLFFHKQVAHAQYIFGSERGRKMGATDGLIDFLIGELPKCGIDKFSLGTSTNPKTGLTNHGLLIWKKGWSQQSCFVNAYNLWL